MSIFITNKCGNDVIINNIVLPDNDSMTVTSVPDIILKITDPPVTIRYGLEGWSFKNCHNFHENVEVPSNVQGNNNNLFLTADCNSDGTVQITLLFVGGQYHFPGPSRASGPSRPSGPPPPPPPPPPKKKSSTMLIAIVAVVVVLLLFIGFVAYKTHQNNFVQS